MATNSQWATASAPLTAGRRVLAVSALKGERVHNFAGEDLGRIDEIVVDFDSGRVAYVVISLGGFLGIGDKLFPVPWEFFSFRTDSHEFFLDVERQLLLDAPGFERTKWPDMSDKAWEIEIHSHYAQKPYWNSEITDASDYVGNSR